MQEIREYPLKPEGVQSIELPKGARPITVGQDAFCLVALVDPMEKEETRHQVITVKVGEKLPDGGAMQFLGIRGDWFVFLQD